jgi:hypothetical protein
MAETMYHDIDRGYINRNKCNLGCQLKFRTPKRQIGVHGLQEHHHFLLQFVVIIHPRPLSVRLSLRRSLVEGASVSTGSTYGGVNGYPLNTFQN